MARTFRRGLTPASGALIGAFLGARPRDEVHAARLRPGAALARSRWLSARLARRAAARAALARGARGALAARRGAGASLYLPLNHLVVAPRRAPRGRRQRLPRGAPARTSASPTSSATSGSCSCRTAACTRSSPTCRSRHTWFTGLRRHVRLARLHFPDWVYGIARRARLVVRRAGRRRARAPPRGAARARWASSRCTWSRSSGCAWRSASQSYREAIPTGELFEQARYLLPLLCLYAAIVALAARAGGRRWGPALGAALVVLAIGHDLFAQADHDRPLLRMSGRRRRSRSRCATAASCSTARWRRWRADRRARAARVRLGLDATARRELARAHGARVIEIAPREFSHGGTRNLLMAEAAGAHVALLTQDAEPADERWLSGCSRASRSRDDVAIVYGPYRPARRALAAPVRLGARAVVLLALPRRSPRVERLRERRARAAGGRADRARAASSPTPTPASRARRGSGCPSARSPTPRTGCWRSTCCAPATPRRSCRARPCSTPTTTPPASSCAAAFDEWRGLREVYGWREPASPAHLAGQLRGALGQARRAADRARAVARRRRRATLAAVAATMSCASPARCSARAPTGCRRRAPAGCRSRGAAGFAAPGARRRAQLNATDPTATQVLNAMSDNPLDGRPQGAFSNLRRRIYLTYTYLGLRTILFRGAHASRCASPRCERRMRLRTHARDQELRRARRLVSRARPAGDIVIPSYRDAEHVRALVRSISKTVPRGMARVIVADDCSGPEHLAALRAIDGIDLLVAGEQQRGLRRERQPRPARERRRARRGRAELRHRGAAELARVSAVRGPPRPRTSAIVGAQLQYPDGRIQFGGTVRNRDAAGVVRPPLPLQARRLGPRRRCASPALAVTGACMYVRRELIERIGLLDERYAMAYEDVDWCLRAWQAGFRVLYFPARPARPPRVGHARHRGGRARARLPAAVLGALVGLLRRARGAHPESGELRIVYVTEDTGVGGGHRDIFEHLNRLAARGHDVVAVHARRSARLVPAAACRCTASPTTTSSPTRSPRSTRSRSPRGGRPPAPVWRASIAARHPGVLRAGHRDLLLPRRRARPPRRARLLPARVPLHDDLLLEPRAAARARPRRRADPAGDRPRHLPPARGGGAPRGHGARAGTLEPAEEPAAHARRVAGAAARAAPGAVPVRDRARAGHGGGHALRRLPRRRAGQRAVLPGDRVRPDLHPRGLRAAAAGGDGDRRRRRVHRRARQPRLLRATASTA